ncbi:hypothetical protein CNMCM5623_007827 [Aspergillus felis]|uniref:DNA 3'-5' helicase n=1 Tax=Aspergillus felis TaxID=1287682 RepID=A0A8H6QIJ9_9EURO|nr:hypothetical protein CNMCM5623_007827 [Aspergillus felis]
MIDRLRAEPAMQRHFMRGGRFHPSAIQQYWQRVAQFKEKLAIIVHVTAGQPARAPELLSIQYCNTVNSRQRNIYIEDGMVTFVTAYHKGFHASNNVKIIHRYVPREVGELVAAQAAQGSHAVQGSRAALGIQAAQGSQAAQGNQAVQAWLWGPDPGTGREWSSERFQEALKQETHTRLGTAIHISAYRDIAIGISRRFLRPSTAFPYNIQDEPAPAMDADAEEGMDIEHTPGHPSILGKRKQAPWEDEAKVSRMERRHQLATMDLEAAAQRMTGRPNMRFQGVQDPAMRAIQQGESPVVAVMPTSGGKSMLFMVPAFAAPGGTTIVVESQRPPNTASIVLVTPESAVSPDFQTFLNRLRWTRRLDQIVINECHVAYTQMVWLTATLPPSMEDKLCRRIKHDQAAVTIYRARTSRPNVAYRVWRPDMTGDRIQQATGGKVIIYANIIRQVTAIARVLGCEAYYSEQLDKAGVLAWFMGASLVITATSALGMGVDIPNIHSIIHIRTPRTLLDYAQESGRAGRDGQRSKAIIIQPVGWDAPAPWMEGVAPEDQEQVTKYMGMGWWTGISGGIARMQMPGSRHVMGVNPIGRGQ